jgi:hypothetical protein
MRITLPSPRSSAFLSPDIASVSGESRRASANQRFACGWSFLFAPRFALRKGLRRKEGFAYHLSRR